MLKTQLNDSVLLIWTRTYEQKIGFKSENQKRKAGHLRGQNFNDNWLYQLNHWWKDNQSNDWSLADQMDPRNGPKYRRSTKAFTASIKVIERVLLRRGQNVFL